MHGKIVPTVATIIVLGLCAIIASGLLAAIGYQLGKLIALHH